MSRADDLLFRIEEASIRKLNLSPGKVKLSGGSIKQLRKSDTVGSPLLKKGVGEQPTSNAVADAQQNAENGLSIDSGYGVVYGASVLFVEVRKTKPFAPLVIDKKFINEIASIMGRAAIDAANSADKKGVVYEALVVAGYFSPGKEAKRFRKCVAKTASLVGGRIVDNLETGEGQLYVIA
jgi:hypothetical protein